MKRIQAINMQILYKTNFRKRVDKGFFLQKRKPNFHLFIEFIYFDLHFYLRVALFHFTPVLYYKLHCFKSK